MKDETPGFWRSVMEVCRKVADCPENERESLLEEICDDPTVREKVTSLFHEGTFEGFLKIPEDYLLADSGGDSGDDATAPLTMPSAEFPPAGTRFGPYEVARGLGIGGMGQVVLAERADGAYERRVALKLLPRNHPWEGASRAALAERRVLGKLEHPGIASLFDAGTTKDGIPWFAMEYVDGMPIDAFVAERRLAVRQIVELIIQVCEPLQYAHERLIVHRDLKPSNIFITHDGVVKLLDFGIAKQLDDVDGSQTSSGLMTPRFAAPEQVSRGIISTATDVYGLGMVLYELLVGGPAYGASFTDPFDWQQRVMTREPTTPSRAARKPAHARILRGELDAILLKALRKDAVRRYPTVAAFADDLRAHLTSRPVSAVRGTRWYTLSRFVRRHRRKVVAIASIALAVAIGSGAALWQSRVAARERDRALVAETELLALHGFLLDEMLAAASPEIARGDDLRVRDVLDQASRRVGATFVDQPRLESSMRMTLASTYRALGELDSASDQATAALSVLEQFDGATEHDRLLALLELAEIDTLAARYAEARNRATAVLDAMLASSTPDDPLRYRAEIAIADTFARSERGGKAESLLRPLMESIDRLYPDDWELRVEVRETLARALAEELKLAESESMLRQILDLQLQFLDDEHPDYLATLRDLGATHFRQLRYSDAEAVHRRVLEARSRVFGPNHPLTAASKYDLGVALRRMDRYDESRALIRSSLDDYMDTLGPSHPSTLTAMRSIAIDTKFAGDFEEAQRLYSLLLEGTRATYGDHNRQTLVAMRDMYLLAFRRGDEVLAEELGQELIDVYTVTAGTEEVTPYILYDFADFLIDVPTKSLRDLPRALEIAERSVELSERGLYKPWQILGYALEKSDLPLRAAEAYRQALALPEGVQSWGTERRLVSIYRDNEQVDRAEALLLQMYERRLKERGVNDDLAAQSLQVLGEMYVDYERYEEAELTFRRAAEQFSRAVLPSDWRAAWNRSTLGEVIALQGRYAEAEPILLDGFRILDEDRETRRRTLEDARNRIVRLYEAWGRSAQADVWRTRELDGR